MNLVEKYNVNDILMTSFVYSKGTFRSPPVQGFEDLYAHVKRMFSSNNILKVMHVNSFKEMEFLSTHRIAMSMSYDNVQGAVRSIINSAAFYANFEWERVTLNVYRDRIQITFLCEGDVCKYVVIRESAVGDGFRDTIKVI